MKLSIEETIKAYTNENGFAWGINTVMKSLAPGASYDLTSAGEFIMFEDHEIKLKKGDLLIFPSIFLYPHKVEPVKKGIRYSFISWVW